MRLALLTLCLALLPGCGYLFKGLETEERKSPELSLIFGTIRIEGLVLTFDELILERISPSPRSELSITPWGHFRLFRPKLVHAGAFIIPNVPPGVYRLKLLRQANVTWHTEGEDPLMRIEVTEPGVYDGGAFVVHGERTFTQEGQPDHVSRYALLLKATRGSQWEPAAKALADKMVGDLSGR